MLELELENRAWAGGVYFISVGLVGVDFVDDVDHNERISRCRRILSMARPKVVVVSLGWRMDGWYRDRHQTIGRLVVGVCIELPSQAFPLA